MLSKADSVLESREGRKEKYPSYRPNGKVICGDQLPFIPV